MDTITNAEDTLSTTARMRAMREIESEPEYTAPEGETSLLDDCAAFVKRADELGFGKPQVQYSKEDLLDICESHRHPAIRRSAANLLWEMGAREGK